MFFSLLHRKQRQTSVNLWLFRYRTQETKILCRPVLTALGTTHHWDCFGCRLSHKELANGSCQQKDCLPPKLKFVSFRALGRKTPLVSSHHQNGLALRLAGDSDHGTLCIRLISLTEPYNIWTDIWDCPRCDTSTLEYNASHLVVFGTVILIGVSLAQQWRWARFLCSDSATILLPSAAPNCALSSTSWPHTWSSPSLNRRVSFPWDYQQCQDPKPSLGGGTAS